MNLKAIWGLFKETFKEWNDDKASRLAAALSYYTVFSLAPLLIIVIAIAGAVFDEAAATDAISKQLSGLVGPAGAEFIETTIQNADKPREASIASLISVIVLLFGASGVFAQLQDALNTIWEVQPKPGLGIMNILRERFLSFTMVLGVGFLLLVSLVLSTVLSALVAYFSNLLPGVDFIWQILNFIIGFAVTTILFGLIFQVLPDVKIAWSDVGIGAAITSLLFTIGRFVLGQYLGNSSFSSTYGAAGSLVVILAWVYYAAQILFFGAEFTQVYARRYGSQIVPTDNAIPLTKDARANQGMKRTGTDQPEQSSQNKSASPNLISRLFRRFTQPKRLKRRRKNRLF